MDFHSILNIAQKKQQINEKKKPSGLNTKFTAPKKERKTKEKTSEAIRKLLEEKEQEKRNKEKAEKQKVRELEKANRFRIPKGESSKDKTKRKEVELPEAPVEEVVIHKEDFVKSSSKRRQAHNPGFVHRPVVAPVKDEQAIKEECEATIPQDSTVTSKRHSSHKHRISSKSQSDSSLSSNSLEKHASKHHKSATNLSTLSSKHHKSATNLSTLSSKHHKSATNLSTLSSKHTSSKSTSHKSSSSFSNKDKSQPFASNKNGISKTQSNEKPVQKKKPRPPPPPPMDFGALLKLAEQKHKEVPQTEVVKKPVKKTEPEGDLMTQEEKDRLERTKSKSYKEWLKHGTTSSTPESLVKKHVNNEKRNEYTKLKSKPDAVKRKLCSDERKPNIKLKVAKLDPVRNEPNRKTNEISSRVNLKEKFRTKSAGASVGISRSNGARPSSTGEGITSKVNLKEKFRTKSAGGSGEISRSNGARPNNTGVGITSKVNLKEKFRTKSAGGSGEISRSNGARPNNTGVGIHSKDNLKEKFRTNSSNGTTHPATLQSHKINSASKVNMNERLQSKNVVSSRPLTLASGNKKPGQTVSTTLKNRPQTSLQKTKSESGLDRRKAPTMPVRAGPPSLGKKPRPHAYSTMNENVLVCGPSRKEESAKSSNPWDRIYGQIQKNRPMPVKRPLDEYEDSEEEWSDEDDDFIDDDFVDDAPIGADNYSSHLKEMFGYSYKDRFRNFDDRDTNMVSTFAQQMKEEARSSRLGKKEDLEDMMKELEEIKQKKLAKKTKLG